MPRVKTFLRLHAPQCRIARQKAVLSSEGLLDGSFPLFLSVLEIMFTVYKNGTECFHGTHLALSSVVLHNTAFPNLPNFHHNEAVPKQNSICSPSKSVRTLSLMHTQNSLLHLTLLTLPGLLSVSFTARHHCFFLLIHQRFNS